MKITKSADFALRIVIHLAQNPEGSTMPLLAETLEIPYNNLSKLIQQMARGGIIQTRQGKNGGVSLISADDLSIKDVIEIIDGPTRLSECLKNHEFCSRVSGCKLKGVLADIQLNIDHLLDSYKIAQLV
jgi:Rrf2 family protein